MAVAAIMRSTVKTVAVVSQVWRGHVPAYHRAYAHAFSRLGVQVIEITPSAGKEAAASNGDPREVWPKAFFRQTRLGRLLLGIKWWLWAARRIQAMERETKVHVQAVFFTYLDLHFLGSAVPGWLVSILVRRSWAGVVLHPACLYASCGVFPKEEGILRSRLCRAVVVVDDDFQDQCELTWPGKRVITGPELADVSTPAASDPIASEVRAWANGRFIVGVLGVITAKKNVAAFVDAARLSFAVSDDIVFIIAGEFSPAASGQDFGSLGKSLVDLPPNCRSWTAAIEDGASFNAVLAACDAVFLAYAPAPEKSNVLTKAAYFHKPVIASAGHLMAQAVERFNLGEIVPAGDADSAFRAVRKLAAGRPAMRDFDGFYRLNSQARVAEAAEKVLAAWP